MRLASLSSLSLPPGAIQSLLSSAPLLPVSGSKLRRTTLGPAVHLSRPWPPEAAWREAPQSAGGASQGVLGSPGSLRQTRPVTPTSSKSTNTHTSHLSTPRVRWCENEAQSDAQTKHSLHHHRPSKPRCVFNQWLPTAAVSPPVGFPSSQSHKPNVITLFIRSESS